MPLAALATVVQALPPAPPRRRLDAPVVSIAIALAVMAVALALNSPFRDLLGHEWAWGLIGFWAELGGLMALLGMLFRQPILAWIGATAFFGVALVLSKVAWPGHLLALALLAAVVLYQVRVQARQDEQRERRDQERREQGWLPG